MVSLFINEMTNYPKNTKQYSHIQLFNQKRVASASKATRMLSDQVEVHHDSTADAGDLTAEVPSFTHYEELNKIDSLQGPSSDDSDNSFFSNASP